MSMQTLRDLFIDQVRDVFDAEKQLVKALPKMAKAAGSGDLRQAFEEHLQETEKHVERLEEVFRQLDHKPRGKTCEAMKGLVAEGKEIIEMEADGDVRDAGLIAAAQKVEHYEMANYGTLCAWAKQLGLNDAIQLLHDTFEEEKAADQKLTQIAESHVNMQAQV